MRSPASYFFPRVFAVVFDLTAATLPGIATILALGFAAAPFDVNSFAAGMAAILALGFAAAAFEVDGFLGAAGMAAILALGFASTPCDADGFLAAAGLEADLDPGVEFYINVRQIIIHRCNSFRSVRTFGASLTQPEGPWVKVGVED